MTFPTTITATQANKETPIGEMFTDLVWAALGGLDPVGTSGLTFGVHGGPMLIDGVLTTIADQTTLLGASTTSYVEWTRAGVLSNNTTGFTAGREPLYVVTTSASGVASYVDWRVWHARPGITGRLSKSVAGSTDVTLSAAEARCEILDFTGVLTGSINVIVPNGPQRWTVTNNASGAFTLTVKTAAGTGIAVTQGKAAGLVADGTNVILGNNDAAAVGGSLLSANNLSDLASAATARTNLGLGTSAVLDVDTDGTLAANDDARVPSQKAIKTAIAAAVAGLSWKQAVRAATTSAHTLATDFENGDTIDGVVLATGDRVLVKNQSTASENGIYIVAASGAPARAADADSGAELVNASVYVSDGTTLADTQWTCTTNATITVGSTSLAFAQLTSGSGTPGGSDKQVQYNNAGAFGAEAGFEYDAATNTLSVEKITTTGLVSTPASATGGAGLRVAHGTAPTSPVDGDVWTTTAGIYVRINGATVGPLSIGGGGSTQGKHAIYIAAGSMRPSVSGGCAPLAAVATSANQPDIQSLDFDATAQEFAQFYVAMPKSWNAGTVTFSSIWSHAATTTSFGVVWQLQGYAASDNDAIATAYGTAQTSTDTGGTTNNIYKGPESSAITIAGTPAKEDVVFFRVARNPADASDTLAIDARLMGLMLYITTDADTDA